MLLVCKRNVETRTYTDKTEHCFTFPAEAKFPTVQTLKTFIRGLYNIPDGEHIDLCKFVPWEFEWRHVDPNQMVEERAKKKGKKKSQVKVTNIDLRNYPHFLADGDIIGVRLGKDDPQSQDDFQTDADLITKAEFNLMKEQQKEKQKEALAEARRNQNNNKANNEHSLFINLDD